MKLVEEKKCSVCKLVKKASEFIKDNRLKSGLHSHCRKCQSVKYKKFLEKPGFKEDQKIYRKKYYDEKEKNFLLPQPIIIRKAYLKRIYNLEVEEYVALIEKQNNKCAICGKEETELTRNNNKKAISIDHCHKTGRIRGLLCGKCNKGIGYFNDDIEILQKAIEYLKTKI